MATPENQDVPTIIGASGSLDTAHNKVPVATTPSSHTSVRFLPYMSPSRPAIGVATPPLSTYAVSSHVVSISDEWSECDSDVTAGNRRAPSSV